MVKPVALVTALEGVAAAVCRLEPAPQEYVPFRRYRWTAWAQLLEQVFKVDVGRCEGRQLPMQIVAALRDPRVIDGITPVGP
jgi:hypothetical protein